MDYDRRTRVALKKGIWPIGSRFVACVGAARENARQAREEISSEMWEGINRLTEQQQQ